MLAITAASIGSRLFDGYPFEQPPPHAPPLARVTRFANARNNIVNKRNCAEGKLQSSQG
jgi:hypothetical protein